ncbi:T-box protein [Fasciola gigantica]|uniref:T-box protein n=1 Tax=Fasciola gigantica TaxID=46835 RepID=A0A504YXK4_FASGI|nr:T-box protein [Fasciola gigantica]
MKMNKSKVEIVTTGHPHNTEPGETFLSLLTYTSDLQAADCAEQSTVKCHQPIPTSSPFFLHDSSSGGDTSIQSYLGQNRPEPMDGGAEESSNEGYYACGIDKATSLCRSCHEDSTFDRTTHIPVMGLPEPNQGMCMDAERIKPDCLITSGPNRQQQQSQQQHAAYSTEVLTPKLFLTHPPSGRNPMSEYQDLDLNTFPSPIIRSYIPCEMTIPNSFHTNNSISNQTYTTSYCHSPTTMIPSSAAIQGRLDHISPKHFSSAPPHPYHGLPNDSQASNLMQTKGYYRWNYDHFPGMNCPETSRLPSPATVPMNYCWVNRPQKPHCCTQWAEKKASVSRSTADRQPPATSHCMQACVTHHDPTAQKHHNLILGPWGQSTSGAHMSNLHSYQTVTAHRRANSVKRVSRRRCQWARSRNPLGSRSDDLRSAYSGESFAYPISMISCPSEGFRETGLKWDREALAQVIPTVSPEIALQWLTSDLPLFQSACIVNLTNRSPGFGLSPAGESVQLRLKDAKTWAQLHAFGTEMIATNTGRRVFPSLSIDVTGLCPMETYMFILDMTLVQPHVFKHQGGQWMISSQAPDPKLSERKHSPHVYVQEDSPKLGSYWMESGVNFTRVKITNNRNHHNPNVIHVYSMHQYAPRFTIFRVTNPTIVRTVAHGENSSSNIYRANVTDVGQNHLELVGSYLIPGTQFYTVTAYQNPEVIRVKIENNPFAKGFRNRQMQHVDMGDMLSVYHHVSSGLETEQTAASAHSSANSGASVASYLGC